MLCTTLAKRRRTLASGPPDVREQSAQGIRRLLHPRGYLLEVRYKAPLTTQCEAQVTDSGPHRNGHIGDYYLCIGGALFGGR